MVHPGRVYYEGTYEEWEEYLEKAAARARQQRHLIGIETPSSEAQPDSDDLSQI